MTDWPGGGFALLALRLIPRQMSLECSENGLAVLHLYGKAMAHCLPIGRGGGDDLPRFLRLCLGQLIAVILQQAL